MEVLSGALDESMAEVLGVVVLVLLMVVVNGTVVVMFPQFPLVVFAPSICVTLFTTT